MPSKETILSFSCSFLLLKLSYVIARGRKAVPIRLSKQKSGCSVASASVYDKDTGKPAASSKGNESSRPPGGSPSFCRSSDSYVQMVSIHALASPSQPGLSRSVTCFRRKSCAPYLQHELRARLSSPVVFRFLTGFPCSANKNACPTLLSSGVAHTPQKPELYELVRRTRYSRRTSAS